MWLLLESVVDRLSEFGAGMDLYGPWMDETASRDLLSRAGAGQRSTSGLQLCLRTVSVTKYTDGCGLCQVPGRTLSISLGGSLGRQDWPYIMAERGLN